MDNFEEQHAQQELAAPAELGTPLWMGRLSAATIISIGVVELSDRLSTLNDADMAERAGIVAIGVGVVGLAGFTLAHAYKGSRLESHVKRLLDDPQSGEDPKNEQPPGQS